MKQDSWWDEDRVNLLKDYWSQGFPASEVAASMKTTRNAVIGKVHRLGLEKRGQGKNPPKGHPSRLRGRRRNSAGHGTSRRTHQFSASLALRPAEPPQPVPGGVSILDLEHQHCRAVIGIGDDGLARFCGADKEPLVMGESSYCSTHGDIYFNRP